jgi:RecA-family ATPase
MEWVLPGWIPRQQAVGFYGVGGVQKTNWLIQLGATVSHGGLDFLGFQMPKMPVLALFCEDTREEIMRRLDRIALHYGLTRRDFPDFHFASLVGYAQPEFVEFNNNEMKICEALLRFDEKLKETDAGLAILDTASHFFGGEEVRRRDVTRFIRQLDANSITRRCGIVFSRHPSVRGAGKGGRLESGSTGWEASVRARIGLTWPREEDSKDEDPLAMEKTNERTLTLIKANYGRPGSTIDMIVENGVFIPKFATDPGAVQKPTRPTPEQIGAACEKKFFELLKQVEKQGLYVSRASTSPTITRRQCSPK